MIKLFGVARSLVSGVFLLLLTSFHPYYVSVTDIKYKAADKTIQVSCKLFTNDLETTLRKIHKKQIDLLNPKDRTIEEKILAHYIITHLKITLNSKPLILNFIGYEKEEEAVWSYFEVKNVSLPKEIKIENTLLYEYFLTQINMVHTEVNGEKKSSKVTNPDKYLAFTY